MIGKEKEACGSAEGTGGTLNPHGLSETINIEFKV